LEERVEARFESMSGRAAGFVTPAAAEQQARARAIAGILCLLGLLAMLILAAAALGRLALGPWRPHVDALDYAAAVGLRSMRSRGLDAAMLFLSGIGEMVPMAVLTGSLFVYLLLRGKRFSALCAGISMPGTAIMWKITSLLVQRHRPDYWMIHDRADLGYPGGHIMNAVVIAGVCLAMSLPRQRSPWQRAALLGAWLLFVAGTGMSRIYLNAHFLTDNIAGLAMGLVWVSIAPTVCRWSFPDCRDAEG
jgi:membrane-associated phospholipid phosphatase